jgi:Caspase domain
VTLLHDSGMPAQAGTHVLAIGVGSYPHLLGGAPGQLANKPLGLKQLQSPPVSVKAFLDWFLAPVLAVGAPGFSNASAPLASVEALASSTAGTTINTPTGAQALCSATRQEIQHAFDAWLARLKAHPDNVGVFYFCGHGVMVSEHYLLAEDFGRNNNRPWENAFDITTTIRAIEREVPGAVYLFIDACREISRDVAMTLGAKGDELATVDLNKRVVRKSLTAIYATGEGELAFAPPGGEVSRFTSALLCAMTGYCGIMPPAGPTWNVDGETIAAAVRQLLEFDTLINKGNPGMGKQVSEQTVQGSSVPLLRLASAPKVKVWLDLTPSQRRALYELYLVSERGYRVAQSLVDQVFQIEVPRGFYEVGAQDPTGALPAVIYQQEELVPPTYPLILQAAP